MSGFYNVITTDNNTILLAYFSELIETNTNLDITDNEEMLTSKLCFEIKENVLSQVQCPAVYNDQALGYPLANKKISYIKTK